MDLHFSLSWWTPEIYLRAGPVHLYVSLWKALLLVALVALFVRFLRAQTKVAEERLDRSVIPVLIVGALYVAVVAWPVGLEGFALPWNNPPGYLHINGRDYGTGQGTPDPRVDTYGCNSEEAIRDGSFAADPETITQLKQIGHLAGIFGGPALYQAKSATGGWLIVRPTDGCWIPYPQYI